APFTGNDPIEILENLRSQDPPPLAEVDPTLPTELGAILERALQKDPTRRFATLGQMRAQLLQVRRKLSEEAERVRRDVQSRLRRPPEVREALQAAPGGRRGRSRPGWAVPGRTRPCSWSRTTPRSPRSSASTRTPPRGSSGCKSCSRGRTRSARRWTAAWRPC